MARLLKRFSIKSGDILALKHKSENANAEAIDVISKALTHLKVNALIVVVDDFDDMSVLNETEMNRLGWYRFNSLAKLMKLPPKDIQ